MATINLGDRGTFSKTWVRYSAVALALALVGLGVKTFWLDQQRYLVPVSIIPAGAALADARWEQVSVNLGSIGRYYLESASKPTGYALQTMYPGRLVDLAQVGTTSPGSLERVVVTNKTQLGSGVRVGADVAVWAAQRLASNQFDAPKRLVADAQVARVIKGSSVFSTQNQQVELLIDPLQTPAVLEAMASDSALFLVGQQ